MQTSQIFIDAEFEVRSKCCERFESSTSSTATISHPSNFEHAGQGVLHMAGEILADASPEKRLFISLITRDISLAEALLDLIDNSINAALEPLAPNLKTADDYQKLLKNTNIKPKVQIELTVGLGKIGVYDNAPGISLKTAEQHVFKFGRDEDNAEANDRLSVYGIGLKRAMFKCGNKVSIISDHRNGGFALDLNVNAWAKQKDLPWGFKITPRGPTKKIDCGTTIEISDLHDEVRRRLDDGVFLSQLRERIARTYSFFIGRVVDITVNNVAIEKETFEIGSNYSNENFKSGNVSCNITAGIAATAGEHFRDKNSGWFVFCNGRAVLFAEKSIITGWAGEGLPIFQPKHRPFLGIVFFVSTNPEMLPWTTTKASINQESAIWQEAKRRMVTVGRVVVNFLDRRYTDEGTEIAPSELKGAAGKRVSIFSVSVAAKRSFNPPKKPTTKTTHIQYKVKLEDLERIESYLRKPGMGGSAVGRYTFKYFMENEVGDEE